MSLISAPPWASPAPCLKPELRRFSGGYTSAVLRDLLHISNQGLAGPLNGNVAFQRLNSKSYFKTVFWGLT